MSPPLPTARDFYLALIEVISTGESRRVGNTILSPRQEWPTSETALWGMALDLEKAEREAQGVAA